MKNKKYHTVETVPKSNRTIVERGKIDVRKIGEDIPMLNFEKAD
jgi:hypothetical protein